MSLADLIMNNITMNLRTGFVAPWPYNITNHIEMLIMIAPNKTNFVW